MTSPGIEETAKITPAVECNFFFILWLRIMLDDPAATLQLQAHMGARLTGFDGMDFYGLFEISLANAALENLSFCSPLGSQVISLPRQIAILYRQWRENPPTFRVLQNWADSRGFNRRVREA